MWHCLFEILYLNSGHLLQELLISKNHLRAPTIVRSGYVRNMGQVQKRCARAEDMKFERDTNDSIAIKKLCSLDF